MATTIDLSGKVAIITGASRGIGQSIAEQYAQAGAKVVLASRKQDALDEVAASIKENGGEALAIAAHTGKKKPSKNWLIKQSKLMAKLIF